MQKLEALRCSACGAPLPADTSTLQIITCTYCGTSQQRVDIEKYMTQLQADVFRWVQSMVPTVGTGASITQVDPLARAQIFEHSIKQEIERKQNATGIQLISTCSNSLLLPPFLPPPPYFRVAGGSLDPKSLLGETAMLDGLLPFAQSDQQQSLLNGAVSSYGTLAYVSNAIRGIINGDPISYATVARNFQASNESLSKDKTKSVGAERMLGISFAYQAIEMMLKGNFEDALGKLGEAESHIQSAQKSIITQTSIISWFAGIKSEASFISFLKLIAQGLRAGKTAGVGSGEMLKKLERHTKSFELARRLSSKVLQVSDQVDAETYGELARSFSEVNLAKYGRQPATILNAGGDIYLACWLVELNYSFATGALFMKKGLMVKDRILLPGIFTLNAGKIPYAPEEMLTDIFSLKAPSSFFDKMAGRETTLTVDVWGSSQSLQSSTLPSNIPVVPVLSTRFESERAVGIYLERVRQRLQNKLRIGIPSVQKVVYVSGVIRNGRIVIGNLPESAQPVVGDRKDLVELAL